MLRLMVFTGHPLTMIGRTVIKHSIIWNNATNGQCMLYGDFKEHKRVWLWHRKTRQQTKMSKSRLPNFKQDQWTLRIQLTTFQEKTTNTQTTVATTSHPKTTNPRELLSLIRFRKRDMPPKINKKKNRKNLTNPRKPRNTLKKKKVLIHFLKLR